MKKILFFTTVALAILSCAKEKGNLKINGHVKGLKKGVLYLQKIEDTLLVNIDSLKIDGISDFEFTTNIDEPTALFLYLDKNDGNVLNDQIEFFADPGIVTINTSVDNFLLEAKVEGSESHKKLEFYKNMISKYSSKNLDYIKDKLEALKKGDSVKADSIQTLADKNLLRTYQFTINYALRHNDSHIAPYITLSRAGNIALKYLDSINNSLSPDVASSKYGVALNAYIQKIKEQESQTEEKE